MEPSSRNPASVAAACLIACRLIKMEHSYYQKEHSSKEILIKKEHSYYQKELVGTLIKRNTH